MTEPPKRPSPLTWENACDGCNRCTCTAKGQWFCETIRECTEEQQDIIEEEDLNRALDMLVYDMEDNDRIIAATSKTPNVPQPPNSERVEKLLGEHIKSKIKFQGDSVEMKKEDEVLGFFLRNKRSVSDQKTSDENDNGTITFFHTMDATNEDTLKNSNASGTLIASKVEMIPQASRRTTLENNSTSKSLQIEYAPPMSNQHAADNKVDTSAIHDDKEDLLIHHKIYEMAGNQSQATRDKELSKLVVNELKGGAETIGDTNSPVISNITFTSENDTLTAMAFIAGNLLNKLWNMEKDASDNSLETEKIKQDKINNLLELFKEPLNLRQETFLKNALEELSSAMEKKDMQNIGLCKNIEELKKNASFSEPSETTEISNLRKASESDKQNFEQEKVIITNTLKNKAATVDALNKINHVLDLIKKYERIQNNLSDYKSNHSNYLYAKKSLDKKVTQNEKNILSEFGNILQSLTALLLPNKKSKKVLRGLKNSAIFNNNKDISKKMKSLNMEETTLSAKDKIILDYITHIQNNPSCIFNKPQEVVTPPNIESGILLNLSEFLKIKSLSDLLNQVDLSKPDRKREETEKEEKTPVMYSKLNTTKLDFELSEDYYAHTTEMNPNTNNTQNVTKFEAAKEKLKFHLRTILQDLMELQNYNGKATNKTNIDIAEALPCIYNILNVKKDLNEDITTKQPLKVKLSKTEQLNKVAEVFDKLKKELRRTFQTRRANFGSRPRPKSALVWERTIKNLDIKNKQKTRRNLKEESPKSLDDVMKTIDRIDSSGSNTYKSIAYLVKVPPAETLLLLKTLLVDTKKYTNALVDLNTSIKANNELPIDQYKTIAEFIDNVDLNVNLNHRIVKHLDKVKENFNPLRQEVQYPTRLKDYKVAKEIEAATQTNEVIKLTRNQVINQLIKNRMLYYLRVKEATGQNKNSFSLDLARKVILYLEMGNDALARELYKIFVSKNKFISNNTSVSTDLIPQKYETKKQLNIDINQGNKVPLIDFIEPTAANKGISWANQERLIKQLFSIKNMKI